MRLPSLSTCLRLPKRSSSVRYGPLSLSRNQSNSLFPLANLRRYCVDTLLITLTSMMVTAAYIYLPGHIVTICSHSWYYLFGESFSNSFNATLRGANGSGTTPLGAVTGSGLETMAVAAATARTIAEL